MTGTQSRVETGLAERRGRAADPCTVVIFGAGGDLTKRKLIPALVNLAEGKLLPERFAVIGVSRDERTDDVFRDRLSREIKDFATSPVAPDVWNDFARRCFVTTGDLRTPETYRQLSDLMGRVSRDLGTGGSALFYLSTPPSLISDIIANLSAAGLVREDKGYRRIVIEKPFGRNLETARALNAEITKSVPERQIFRIDHYLGKETVQNLMVFRFANGIFEPIWNRNYVNHVQITVAETLGVEGRGGYYEEAGALRDMVPNHILQLLSLVAMEPPSSFDAEAVRDEKAKLMRAVQPIPPEEVLHRAVRGQYGAGAVKGQAVKGYREEQLVSPTSSTDTFVAMKLLIDNWRWAKVPFYLRTGKRLSTRVTEIAIQFKRAPHQLFRGAHMSRPQPNLLVLHIQPREGVSLRFGAKVPGPQVRMGDVDMDFDYANHFGEKPQTGYETLLYDCMIGDATLFQRADTVELGWDIVEPVLDVWSALTPRSFPNYASFSDGPKEAHALIERDGRAWRALT